MNRLSTARSARMTGCALLLAGLGLLGGCGGSGSPERVTLSGKVENPRGYTRENLMVLPATTQTVRYTASGVAQVRTYVGTSLQGLVEAAGPKVAAEPKNDFLNQYVVVTGTDGYRVVFAQGELRSDFGNWPSLLAHSEVKDGVTGPIVEDGFARVTSPGDTRGGRYVSNVASIELRASAAERLPAGSGPSSSFTVSGSVARSVTFDLAALQALPQQTRTVAGQAYSGPALWQLLNQAVGLRGEAGQNNISLPMYVVATGSDGYRALFSLGELDPNFGNQPTIVALSLNGAALGANGFAHRRAQRREDGALGVQPGEARSLHRHGRQHGDPLGAVGHPQAQALDIYTGLYRFRGPPMMTTALSRRLSRSLAIAALAGLSVAASAADLTVSAAASLTNAFKDLAPLFEAANPGTKLQFNFAASGALLQQIDKGAPVDVFASADQETMDQAQAKGLVQAAQRRNFVSNALVVIVPVASGRVPGAVGELTQATYPRIAIGLPASVPVGRYTKSVLEAAGHWAAIEPKMIGANNVRQALDYVARGEVDAGFVYATDAALMPDKVKVALAVPTTTPILYPAAPIAASPNAALSLRFVEFLGSAPAQAVLTKYGFGKP